jgi:hypothetical protein
MAIPLTPLKPLLLLQQDDCAPDSFESFAASFPSHSGGLSLKEFKSKARRESFDAGFAIYWHLGDLSLSISADDPFYSLHRSYSLIAPTSEENFND